ncbi:MAG: AEC family transporter [Candidatus Omnitrophica bacterium]|nr:AEC family transporter [Candidatus Omnitrophota bacterium]
MFAEAFKTTASAVAQILLLGAIGYFLKKRNILSDAGLDGLSHLVIDVTLPILIFVQLIKDFNFKVYPDWWVFPLLSIGITALALIVGIIFIGFIRDGQKRLQFLSLVTFQNSGYLPLAMFVALLPAYKAGAMLIYLFLFLIGFNLVMWPLAVYILSFSKRAKFEFHNLLNPPVIAAILGVVVVFLGWDRLIPGLAVKPLKLAGDCTLPLAMFVVGADLAKIKIGHFDRNAMSWMVLAKLIVLPALGLWLVLKLRLPELTGLLILLQLAVPPATSLSVIARHYKKEDLIISQGIFFGHILSIITIPVFLSLYFAWAMIR